LERALGALFPNCRRRTCMVWWIREYGCVFEISGGRFVQTQFLQNNRRSVLFQSLFDDTTRFIYKGRPIAEINFQECSTQECSERTRLIQVCKTGSPSNLISRCSGCRLWKLRYHEKGEWVRRYDELFWASVDPMLEGTTGIVAEKVEGNYNEWRVGGGSRSILLQVCIVSSLFIFGTV
jgi:hypothetical protein